MPIQDNLKHIVVSNTATAEDYTSPNQAPRPKFPQRNRNEHAQHLLGQIQTATNLAQQKLNSLPMGAPAPDGIYLEFEGQAGFDVKIQSLDLPSQGVELLSVREVEENGRAKLLATVFVPTEKVGAFIKKVEEYRDKETDSGTPKNSPLVNGLENIRIAVVRSLWTDVAEMFPREDESIWWEIWLRALPESIPRFTSFAQARDIRVSHRQLIFPDRHVILAYTNGRKLASAIDSLGFIAELRRAKETTADFLEMNSIEQNQWAEALNGLTNPLDPANKLSICVLDTGINRLNPLLTNFIPNHKLMSCNPSWGVNDHHGHGTQTAGLALYGDLNSALLSTVRIDLPCELESVKILPPASLGHTQANLYGNVTEEAVSRATISEPDRERVVCMAVASKDGRDRGQPSSWSAAVDNICVGKSIEGKRHLFVLAAGNSDKDQHIHYPDSNMSDQIHDPGQSWNAVTIGAFTDKVQLTEPSYHGWNPLAPAGDIAPGTTTSLTWMRSKWPIKPEVVFEGGNAAINHSRDTVDYPNSLSLLTTNNSNIGPIFTWSADTSAAAAQGSHFAATLFKEYPNFWPETVRALMVHSADWTPEMLRNYSTRTKSEKESLLRICGYGVPSLKKARWSASNSLTLIAQDELKPFEGSRMKHLHIHNLPWPTDELRALGETQVKMKVTLSYFIEPNPARRGWEHKFRYQSHGLRFDVKTSLESITQFQTRLNRKRWDEEAGRGSITSSGDSSEWFFGEQIRTKGSIHSDTWEGSAVSLADRAQIAVYPVVGWWREKHSQGHTNKKARYSLVVTIMTPSTEVDIYTPVENQVFAEIFL